MPGFTAPIAAQRQQQLLDVARRHRLGREILRSSRPAGWCSGFPGTASCCRGSALLIILLAQEGRGALTAGRVTSVLGDIRWRGAT
jgi:hypothetical protein